MKWRGADADREGITAKYIRAGTTGLLAGRVPHMAEQQQLSFPGMVERRLDKGTEPTLKELQGFRQLVEEDLWHPALGRLPEASQD
jgi:hypothetical protein